MILTVQRMRDVKIVVSLTIRNNRLSVYLHINTVDGSPVHIVCFIFRRCNNRNMCAINASNHIRKS